jgi:hypothetical protein
VVSRRYWKRDLRRRPAPVRKLDTNKVNFCLHLSPNAAATTVACTSSEHFKEKLERLGIWLYSRQYEVYVPVSYSFPIHVCLSF